MNKFPLSRLGRAYVYINIKPLNDTIMLPAEFKVDTGADATTISKDALMKLGYNKDWILKNAKRRSNSETTTANLPFNVKQLVAVMFSGVERFVQKQQLQIYHLL